MLAGIYTGCGCAAALIIILLLQPLASERKKRLCHLTKDTLKPKLVVATFLHLRDFRQVLLIPLTVFSGLEQGFFGGDFTQVGYITNYA